ncbi:MAG: HAMP domain-containing sensor histidine kinase [Coleofasciculus sp. G1-WW12-02]|uniref:sensor histidine kinase n=1 Tax=Coleofasciculus sp. G1-WW12-02 TaxID=3068483 RepID=UPI0033019DB4
MNDQGTDVTKPGNNLTSAKFDQNHEASKTKRCWGWRHLFWEARTRILVWYVLLMVCFTATSVGLIRQVLFKEVYKRIDGYLIQEMQEFQQLLQQGKNPFTGQPFDDDITTLFDVFLSRNIPNDGEFLLTIVDGQFYKSSPKALPAPLQPDSELLKGWSNLTKSTKGQEETSVGSILYYVKPVEIGGELRGLFIVANSIAGEEEEINEVIVVIIEVTLIVMVAAFVVAWIAAGRVLAPLRSITETARSISETDLTQRIPLQGYGEMAELTITLNQMLDRVQRAFTSQRDFINDASHELRTPITIIRGHLELWDDDPKAQQETLELVLDELDRMNRFVNDLLLLAKAEWRDFLQVEIIDIDSFTEELFAKAKALAERDWQLDAIASGRIVADRQRLTQAIMNLAENASQHTKPGEQIALGSAINRHYACFWVRDTGDGIDPANQKRIFERFARLPNSRRCSEGAGLGLSIVQAIAQAHRGQVKLKSRLGAGTQFTIVIPLEPKQDILPDESNSDC